MRTRIRDAVIAAVLWAGSVTAQNLTLGTGLQLNTMDPHFFNGFPANNAHAQIFQGLTRSNEGLDWSCPGKMESAC